MQNIKDTANFVYKKVINTVDGKHFNRKAHAQSSRSALKYQDTIDGPYYDSDPGSWEKIKMKGRGRYDSDEGEFNIPDGPGPLKRIATNISLKALETAAEAAGCSKEYAVIAAKYIITEMARDVGWLVNCTAATEAVRNVLTRFPLLADIKQAYEEGAAGIPARIPGQQLLLNGVRTHEPVAGVSHPHHIRGPSNLDDIPLIQDDNIEDDVAYRFGRSLSPVERGRKREREEFPDRSRGASAEMPEEEIARFGTLLERCERS